MKKFPSEAFYVPLAFTELSHLDKMSEEKILVSTPWAKTYNFSKVEKVKT